MEILVSGHRMCPKARTNVKILGQFVVTERRFFGHVWFRINQSNAALVAVLAMHEHRAWPVKSSFLAFHHLCGYSPLAGGVAAPANNDKFHRGATRVSGRLLGGHGISRQYGARRRTPGVWNTVCTHAAARQRVHCPAFIPGLVGTWERGTNAFATHDVSRVKREQIPT